MAKKEIDVADIFLSAEDGISKVGEFLENADDFLDMFSEQEDDEGDEIDAEFEEIDEESDEESDNEEGEW